jgi:transposase-like protein
MKRIKRTIEEKNKIVEEYLNSTSRNIDIVRKYSITTSMLSKWSRQYRENGTVLDNRGKSSKKGINGIGRKKVLRPEDMTREELIEYVKAVEDIKKLIAYQKKPKKNI